MDTQYGGPTVPSPPSCAHVRAYTHVLCLFFVCFEMGQPELCSGECGCIIDLYKVMTKLVVLFSVFYPKNP